jgi:hypothetical protein
MSTIKADAITPVTGNTNLSITGSGTGVVHLGDGALKFPDADGSASQVIQTDGAGQLSFATPSAGGAWTLIGTSVASASASLTITGLDSTYDTYAILLSDILMATDDLDVYIRMGNGSLDSGASDYQWTCSADGSNDGGHLALFNNADSKIEIVSGGQALGNATGEGLGGVLYLTRPSDGTNFPMICGTVVYNDHNALHNIMKATIAGCRQTVKAIDRIQLLGQSGNITSGRLSVFGVAHA